MGSGEEPPSLVDLLQTRAERTPRLTVHTFLADGERPDGALTCGSLDARARCIAARLQAAGLTGRCALLLYPPGLEFIDAFFGCLYAGVVAVPAYPPKANRSFGRLSAILRDAQAAAVLTVESLLDAVRGRLEEANDGSPRLWLATDGVGEGGDDWRKPHADSNTLAFLQYTSGSTGDPKGVMVTHGNILHNVEAIRQMIGLTPESVSVCWLPSFHDMGLITGVIEPVYTGFSNYMMSPAAFLQRPARWLHAISRYRATFSGGPNSAYELCLRTIAREQREGLDLACWSRAFNGAEPIRAETLSRFADVFGPWGFRRESFMPGYGMAEATLMVSCGPVGRGVRLLSVRAGELQRHRIVAAGPDAEDAVSLVGCGAVCPEMEVAVVDPDCCEPSLPGEVGELWVRGPSVARGYWRRLEQTKETFGAHLAGAGGAPFLRTGDLGYVADGQVFVTGRLKDLIIVGGRNFYPQDIEATVEACHPDLSHGTAAAFPVEADREERLVVAVEVQRQSRRTVQPDAVFAAIRRSVAEEHELAVHAIVLLQPSTVPKTSSGKIQRRPCREAFLEGGLQAIATWQAPAAESEAEPLVSRSRARADIEAWLRAQVARRTGLAAEQVDARLSFTAFGFGSMEAVSFAGELERYLGRPVPATIVYDQPGIDSLARWAADEPADRDDSISPRESREPIAVVGMGCRFPGGGGPDEFRSVLERGADCIRQVPAKRSAAWAGLDDPRAAWGGFLDAVDGFDAEFFGMAPKEVAHMDPQQRLLLEVAWETLEDAGCNPRELAGTATGVFVGISGNDYLRLLTTHVPQLDAYVGTGNAASVAANRLSYQFDLRGPSLAVDTACSSSLVAVHLACRALRAGECRAALAGGVNLILSPEISRVFAEAGMLAADGRCKTFAAGADGYVRGEGCGLVLLKRLSDAERDGDKVLAVIRGSAINQDGRSNGLTAPNGPAQEAVLRAALADAGASAADVDYVEAHGTGTELGDPIEVQALGAVLCAGRQPDRPLRIGSVKTNIGHLEAAAGIAGLIKVILALRSGRIPAHLHASELNPHVEWSRLPLQVATEAVSWAASGRRRLAGVSSFGFGGTNAHLLVEEPAPVEAPSPSAAERPVDVLALSARTPEALATRADRLALCLHQDPAVNVHDICHTSGVGRAHFEHRLAIVVRDRRSAIDALESFAGGAASSTESRWHAGGTKPGAGPRVAFLFTGQGSQYAGMGRQLFETQPVFREALLRCDAVFRECRGRSLIELVHAEPGTRAAELIDSTLHAQPALFALEYALAETWRAWGIRPTAVLGHSLGEYAAACTAGVFSPEDGLRLVAERAQLMDAAPGHGAMLAVFAPRERVETLIADGPLSIAAINGDSEIVVSGDADAVARLAGQLERLRITAHPLRVSHAFHSRLMDPVVPAFRAAAARIAFDAPSLAVVSNLYGEAVTDGRLSTPDYWARHLRRTVRFADCVRALVAEGVDTFIEIGPQPVLSALGQRATGRDDLAWLPSLRRSEAEWSTLADAVARLYAAGADIDWAGFDRGYARKRVSLPTYPFQRQRYWFESQRRESTAGQDLADNADDWFYEVRWQPAAHQPVPAAAGFIGSPEAAASDAAPLMRELLDERISPQEPERLGAIEALCADYAAAALLACGVAFAPGSVLAADEIVADGAIGPRHRRLAGRLLAILGESGHLRQTPAGWRVERPVAPDVDAKFRAFETRFGRSSIMAELLARCGGSLAGVLQGRVDPLQLLFPSDETASAERLYRDAPAAAALNAVLADVVGRMAERASPGRMVRILEIGAGTGGTTAAVLPRLPAERVTYAFTDVSSYFLSAARRDFAAYPFVSYATLDIARDPLEQGFERHACDVIVAANVLHATPDLRRTLANVHQLLAPGGALVLLEGTTVRRFLDLTFGLLEGWWSFTDASLRADYPLLSPERWAELLSACGFEATSVLPGGSESDPGLAGQRILIARASQAKTVDARASADGTWLVCSDRGGFAGQLGRSLALRGARCIQVTDAAELGRVLEAADAQSVRGIVFTQPLDGCDSPGEISEMVLRAIDVVRTAANHAASTPPRLWFVTRGGQWVAGERGPVSSGQASLWGLGQVIGLEHPDLWGGTIDLEPKAGAEQIDLVADMLNAPNAESLSAIRDGLVMVPRLQRADVACAQPSLDPEAACLVTGGLGGAGLATARWLAEAGARHLVLMSRRGLDETNSAQRDAIAGLRQRNVEVRVVAADVADRQSLAAALVQIRATGRALKGVIHAAGVPGSRRLIDLGPAEVQEVLRPKLAGAWNLHELTATDPLEFFICFSSASSLLGAEGQGHYAAANRYLDALAAWRRAQGLPGLSINWGRWGSRGMLTDAAHARFAQVGLGAMEPAVAAAATGRALDSGRSGLMVAAVDWAVFKPLYQARRPRPLLDSMEAAESRPGASAEEARGSLDAELTRVAAHERRDLLADAIEREAARAMGVAGSRRLDRSAGFFELGMDSLMAVSLRGRLQGLLDRQLPKTIAFEHPTVEALAAFIHGEYYAEEVAAPARPQAPAAAELAAAERVGGHLNEPIAVVGAGCRLPGGVSDLKSFWRLLRDGVDAVGEVPAGRWDADAWYDPNVDAPGKMYTRSGGFLDEVDRFDPQFFGIAPREAVAMDPQHRLFMEVAWEALENAGCPPTSLKGSRTGVFVGVTANDYSEVLAEHGTPDAYYITGNSLNATAGRISYLLGLRGPSMAVDAACASSLVAVHLACRSLRSGESDAALAGGVNLVLSPRGTVAACRAKMLSPSGKCRTFDAAADGFVRGEGCGVVVLKRLSDALAAGDPILALIRGSAVGQDGASGGLTVPNASAQQEVIGRALADAGVEPAEIDYIEAHGTGTSLGDPIEVRAIEAVFAGARAGKPLQLGSVKTNIGHLESASGIAALIKVILSLRHETIPPHLHLREVNPVIDLEAIPAAIGRTPFAWPVAGRPRLAGVSSFGASGTLAHVIVEDAPSAAAVTSPAERPVSVMALSARTEPALRELAARFDEYVADHPDAALEDLCLTINAGRSHFEHRRVLLVSTRGELIRELRHVAGGSENGMLRGLAERSAQIKVTFEIDADADVDWAAVRSLCRLSPVFEAAVERCEHTFTEHRASLLRSVDGGECDAANRRAAAIALQWSAAQLWRSWGIEPVAVLDRKSLGGLAECIRGTVAIEDTLHGLLSQSPGDGSLAVAASVDPEETVSLSTFAWCDLAERLGRLYVRGASVNWDGFHRGGGGRKVQLPTYPFQRQRCWPEKTIRGDAPPMSARSAETSLLGRRLSLAGSNSVRYETRLRADRPSWLSDHRIGGRTIVPATAYVEMSLQAAGELGGSDAVLEEMVFSQPLELPEGETFTLQTVLTPAGDGRTTFAIFSRPGEESTNGHWLQHAAGVIAKVGDRGAGEELQAVRKRCGQPVNVDAFYAALAVRGLEFGPAFRAVRKLAYGTDEAVGDVRLDDTLDMRAYWFHPALLDACSQVVAAALAPPVDASDLFMLVGMQRLVVYAPVGREAVCHARHAVVGTTEPGRYAADLRIYTPEGRLVAEVAGLIYRRLTGEHAIAARSPGAQSADGNGHGHGNGNGHGKMCDGLCAGGPDRLGRFEQHVGDRVALVLGLDARPDSRTGFFDLGMDSLSAAELVSTLNRDLGRAFPATILFEHGNSGALARYLLQEVGEDVGGNGHGHGQGHVQTAVEYATSGPKPPEGNGSGRADEAPELEGLSPEQIAEMFSRMLDDVEDAS